MDEAIYIQKIWRSRYFWSHLALADIRCKYRRSSMGLAWAVIQPLGLTALYAFVMSHIFHSPMQKYAPFIYSGLIFWEFIAVTAANGCMAFINAEGYIKQFNHPLLIYSLRCTIPAMINLCCAFTGLLAWSVISNPQNFGWSWLALLFSFPLLFFFAWPIASLTAFIGIKFRDFAQLIVLVLQAIYFVSPILFLPSIFIENGLSKLLYCNPVYYLLQLFREPLLNGVAPPLFDYMYILGTALCLWLAVGLFVKHNENKIIFYL